MPATRSPAQIEASRRKRRPLQRPVTPEGKRRASANALKHGLSALHHLVLEDEDPAELERLTAGLLAELGAEGELEARLVRRLAVAFWKGERAERLEVALLDGAPGMKPSARALSTALPGGTGPSTAAPSAPVRADSGNGLRPPSTSVTSASAIGGAVGPSPAATRTSTKRPSTSASVTRSRCPRSSVTPPAAALTQLPRRARRS